MSRSGPGQEQRNGAAVNAPLPLFRPEALVTQDRLYGEILLIRPFSLTVLAWVAFGITGAVLCGLFLVRYPEFVTISGSVVNSPAAAASLSAGTQVEAVIKVPVRWLPALHTRQIVAIRCPSCSDSSARTASTILRASSISAASVGTNVGAADPNRIETLKVTLAFSSGAVAAAPDWRLLQPGAGIELAVPAGRNSLAHWLFERPTH